MMTRALRDYNPEHLAERESQDRQRRRWHKLIEGEAGSTSRAELRKLVSNE